MKEPMDERMKGIMSERDRNIKHRPQNLSKKGANIDQNGAKINPRGSQNEAKTNKKSKQPRQDDLGHPWGVDFLAIVLQPGAILGVKIEPNS